MSAVASRRRGRLERKSAILTLAAMAASAIFILPGLWLVVGSVRPGSEIFSSVSPLSWRILVPSSVSLDNYVNLLSGPFGRALIVSLVVCLLTVGIGLVLSATAAYALAVLNFPGRGAAFAFVVVSFMVPFEAIAIPLSQLFTGWGDQHHHGSGAAGHRQRAGHLQPAAVLPGHPELLP
ncbi:carbohydrate ABC transporter permease [Sanguibacter sp. Z1732]|uniref:carbohydrate ABC transporter permease n=1 Tax=Sanguibacter sp. Z1732 TaxID=3435412 RepID=UPI003D9CB9F6